jgi:hypothetical protein
LISAARIEVLLLRAPAVPVKAIGCNAGFDEPVSIHPLHDPNGNLPVRDLYQVVGISPNSSGTG